jgi:hypothetical protein
MKPDDKQLLLQIQSPLANASADISLLSQNQEDNICKICFEQGSRSNKLITPCRCDGSVRYVHEECLKLWLLASKDQEISQASCELCTTPYLMELKVTWKCSSENILADRLMQLCFLPLLLMVFSVLILILGVLIDQYFDDENQDPEQKNCTLVIIVTCLCTLFVVVYLIASIFKETCCIHSLSYWQIKSQTFLGSPRSACEKPTPEVAPTQSSPITVPANVRVQGVLVRTPAIEAGTLERVLRRDGSVTYRPRTSVNTMHAATSRTGNYAFTISAMPHDSLSVSIS